MIRLNEIIDAGRFDKADLFDGSLKIRDEYFVAVAEYINHLEQDKLQTWIKQYPNILKNIQEEIKQEYNNQNAIECWRGLHFFYEGRELVKEMWRLYQQEVNSVFDLVGFAVTTTSWSTDYQVAKGFANEKNKCGILIKAIIPIEQIVFAHRLISRVVSHEKIGIESFGTLVDREREVTAFGTVNSCKIIEKFDRTLDW